MSDVYDTHIQNTSFIISPGMLVKIGSVLNSHQKNAKVGIIIGCTYGFGITGSEFLVLTEGKLVRIDETMIWSLEEMDVKK